MTEARGDLGSSAKRQRVALALQGGGGHGAFTRGVLDGLLKEPSVEIIGVTGMIAAAPTGIRVCVRSHCASRKIANPRVKGHRCARLNDWFHSHGKTG